MWHSTLRGSTWVALRRVAIPLVLQASLAHAQIVSLPDAPHIQEATTAARAAPLAPDAPGSSQTTASPVELSPGDKARLYLRSLLGFNTILGPAAEAGFVMATPPKAYPDAWKQGAGAYGRNFGASLGRIQTAEFSRFVMGVALREDPRYYRSPNPTLGFRIAHALRFALIDRSDTGRSRPAFATLIGAASGGFVGDAYLPTDYTDLRHAGVRTGVQLGTFAFGNLIEEFTPELKRLTQAMNRRFGR
jgi:hypothetical protein